MDILRLLDDLARQIENTPSYGPITWRLDRDEISLQISKIKASLPQELKTAVNTVRESERIIDTAREDATMTLENAKKEAERLATEARKEVERMLEQARMQQDRMVQESEILKLSKAQSEEIRNSADRDAMSIRRGADKYALDVLFQLEGVVGKAMTAIERGKQELQPQKETPAAPANRERTRV